MECYGRCIVFILLVWLDPYLARPYQDVEKYLQDPCADGIHCQTTGDKIAAINTNYRDPKYKKQFRGGFDERLPSEKHRYRRNARNTDDWPKSDDGLIYIPYYIRGIQTGLRVSENLVKAKREFEKHTCFRLIERTDQYDYVDIHSDGGCWTYVGKIGGRQPMSLSQGCEDMSIILHEFMHVIGFYHEQERVDRDEHIRVNWTNLPVDSYDQFKTKPGFAHGKDYDIHSLMQYGRKAAAVDPRYDAITPVKDPDAVLGAPTGSSFTPGDKRSINLKSLCGVGVTVYGGPYATKLAADDEDLP